MPKPVHIPLVALGAGSQPASSDGLALDYMSMPEGMDSYRMPMIPEPEEVDELQAAKNLLSRLCDAIADYRVGQPAIGFGLDELGGEDLDLVNQILGEGEVSVAVDGASLVQAQESVLAGIWRVRHLDQSGRTTKDTLEIADIPAAVRELSFAQAMEHIQVSADAIPTEVMNAPSMLVEIDDRLRQWEPERQLHVINLTLLPLSREDLIFLGERLGVGPTTILSRGYGNCRIGSTGARNVWWVKYFNSEDALILNTIEITDVPEVALAAQEDLVDSAERLREILEIYQ